MSEKGRKLYNGITNIDDDLIMVALEAKPSAKAAPVKKKKPAIYYVYRWGAAAAAVIALAVVGIILVPAVSKNMSMSTSQSDSMTMNFTSNDVEAATEAVGSSTAEAPSHSIKDTDSYDAEMGNWTNDAETECESSEDCVATAPEPAVELDDNQIMLGVDFDEVEEVTLNYPGHDTVVIENTVAEQIVDLVNSMGILTEKDDYQDVTSEDYATIQFEMSDGSFLEITPKYPYIFIDGEVYECESKNRGIYNLALFINEVCSTYFDGE